jgi:divalent metal cation (Fe/Co/Zn/Cd) transporter
MDASPDPGLTEHIRAAAGAIAGVENIEKCLVRKMGHLYFVDMHVEVAPEMTVERSPWIAHEVKDRVLEKFPSVRDVLVHIEPLGLADLKKSREGAPTSPPPAEK